MMYLSKKENYLVYSLEDHTFKIHVKVESRYGTNLFFAFPDDWSANELITRPSVVNDL